MSTHDVSHRVAVIGGTGPQGRGLAYRFALAGHEVTIGSRAPDRAEARADEIRDRAREHGVEVVVDGDENVSAAKRADVVLLAIPWDGHDEAVAELAPALHGSLVISCVNPLGFDQDGPYGLTLGESAAERAQRIAPGSRVVGAFHHVAALSLWRTPDALTHEDVLVCGDDAEAKATVQELARSVTGKAGIDAGRLRLARQLEPLTAVLISMNKAHKARTGIAITGLGEH